MRVDFPAIREGDLAALVKATVEAMTLDNKGGQVVGIDERAGVLALMRLLDFEDADELIEEMYPSKGPDKYDPIRAQDELPPPIPKLHDQPGGVQPTPAQAQADIDANARSRPKEAMKSAALRLMKAIKLVEAQAHADDAD